MLIFAVFYCVVVLALMTLGQKAFPCGRPLNNVTGVVVECAMEASTLCGELYQKEQERGRSTGGMWRLCQAASVA
eukprot:s6475_g2.t1